MQQRFEMRRSTDIPVKIMTSLWDEPLRLRTADLSPGGLFLSSDLILDPGLPIICSFSLRKEHFIYGRVSRTNRMRRATDRGKPGFGVEFMYTTPITRIRIRESLRGLPPPIPSRKRAEIIELATCRIPLI
jgi:hypothetical protein